MRIQACGTRDIKPTNTFHQNRSDAALATRGTRLRMFVFGAGAFIAGYIGEPRQRTIRFRKTPQPSLPTELGFVGSPRPL